MAGVSTGLAPDELIKNALADYASENFEIASYSSLIAAAQTVGDQETARVCQSILCDEQDMANFLMQHLPMTVQEYMGAQVREHSA